MISKRVAIVAGLLAISAGPVMAQQESQARGATPRDMRQWAVKIQQDYPSTALRNEEQGTVTMHIEIGEDGSVRKCEVTQPSGSAALDEAACRGMEEHARYEPARNHAGEPIADSTIQSVRYLLPQGGTPKHFKSVLPIDENEWRAVVFDETFAEAIEKSETKRSLFVLTVDEEGVPTGCGMFWPSGDAELDRKACAGLLENARFMPAELSDGEKVPSAYPVPYPSFEAVQISR